MRDKLLAANRHTCCICHVPRLPVELHHINGDPASNAWDNLSVLCRNCHGLVTVKGNLGSNYRPGEVLRYKQLWEKRCAEADEDEIEAPVEEVHETKLIDGNGNEEYPFDMDEGDELVFSIDANDYLDLVICEEEDIEAWSKGEHDEERPLPEGYWHKTGIMEASDYRFVAPEDGHYVLLLVNWDKDPTEVAIDAAVWEGEDDDDA
ncbi:MAG: HNH endonuclease [Pseudomonadota bacterium]